MSDLESIVSSVLGEPKPTSGQEVRFCCPYCIKRKGTEDRKFHLYVNTEKSISGNRGCFFCHRCKARGKLSEIVGSDEAIVEQQYSPRQWDDFTDKLTDVIAQARKEPELKKVELPRDYIPVVRGSEAYDYLRNRGISDAQIEIYHIGAGTKNLKDVEREHRKYYCGIGRIVLPDFDRAGRVLYWVARTFRDHKQRYKNPPESNSGSTVYRLDAVSRRFSEVVITEGVFSAIAAGENAVATYGKNVTKTQLSMLADARFDKYIVALDGDAREDAMKLADRLLRAGRKAFLVEFAHDEDPDSVSDIEDRVKDAVPFDFAHRLFFSMNGGRS